MTHHKEHNIESEVASWETLVGLAKEAAKQPTPVAQRDAHFYLQQAEKTGKKLDPQVVRDIDAAFFKTMPERIARVEAVIKKYREQDKPNAKNQIEWYASELARLKEIQRKH